MAATLPRPRPAAWWAVGGDEALLPRQRQSAALPHRYLWLFRELRSSALPFFFLVARRSAFRECGVFEIKQGCSSGACARHVPCSAAVCVRKAIHGIGKLENRKRK